MPASLQFPNLTIAQFLADYWQKKPLYMPNALATFVDPISPDELAGLACEEGTASRIVIERGHDHDSDDVHHNWEVRHGPFKETEFSDLPDTHWSLLVQDVNRYLRELDQLLIPFNFLPDWRIDDVMVSYAEPHGSVGAHVDQYDVFLLQGMGTRRWQISESNNSEFLPDSALRILKDFVPEQEFILNPGDMLYLPAGVQHFGISDVPCMTYSIGFRAPDQLELLGDYIDHCIVKPSPEGTPRYTDPRLDGLTGSGEVTPAALDKIRHQIEQIPSDPVAIQDWFGAFITSTFQATESIPVRSDLSEPFCEELKKYTRLYRDNESRFAYIRQTQGIKLFINGASITLADARADLGCYLCDHREYAKSDLQPWLDNDECIEMLAAWWQHEWIDFDPG